MPCLFKIQSYSNILPIATFDIKNLMNLALICMHKTAKHEPGIIILVTECVVNLLKKCITKHAV